MAEILVSIGDFSRMTYLSVKALRHYHEVGLLEPAVIDRATGYRYYAPSQVGIAQVIRRFRDLGMPLEEVRAVVDAPDVDARRLAMFAHLQRLEEQLAETEAAVGSLRHLLEAGVAPLPVEFRSLPPVTALAVRGTVAAAELGPWWTESFGRLDDAAAAFGLAPAGRRGALYRGDYFEEAVGELTAYLPVATDHVGPGTGSAGALAGIDVLQVPATEVAVAVHEGSLHDLDRTYGALGSFVAERAVGLDGPIREIYLVTYTETADEDQHRTEVCWPVFRTVGAV